MKLPLVFAVWLIVSFFVAPLAFAGLAAGAEIALVPPSFRPASGSQRAPKAASDGTTTMVVWEHASGGDVLGVRFDSEGHLLDRLPLPIATSSEVEGAPDVASTGNGFLIGWSQGQDVYLRFVSADGTLLPPFRLRASFTPQRVRIVANADTYFVVSEADIRSVPSECFASIFSSNGQELVHDLALGVFDGGEWFSNYEAFALASTSTRHLFVGVTRDFDAYMAALHLVLVDSSSGKISSVTRLVTEQELRGAPHASAVGESLAVFWTEGADESTKLKSIVLPKDAPRLGPLDLGGCGCTLSGAGSDGNSFVLLTDHPDGLHSMAVDSTASSVFEEQRISADDWPRLDAAPPAWNQTSFFVPLSAYGDVYGLLLDRRGMRISPSPFWVATSAEAQSGMSVASGAGARLLVWKEERPDQGGSVVVSGMLGADGALSNVMMLSAAEPYLESPHAAYDGSGYLVAWSTSGLTAYSRRLTGEGTPVDVPSLLERTGAEDVGWNGSNYLLVWSMPSSATACALIAMQERWRSLTQ